MCLLAWPSDLQSGRQAATGHPHDPWDGLSLGPALLADGDQPGREGQADVAGPTSQMPLLQAKFAVPSVGAPAVAAVADPAASRLARSRAGARTAAARHSLYGMVPLEVGPFRSRW